MAETKGLHVSPDHDRKIDQKQFSINALAATCRKYSTLPRSKTYQDLYQDRVLEATVDRGNNQSGVVQELSKLRDQWALKT